jgi:hypothetical protein
VRAALFSCVAWLAAGCVIGPSSADAGAGDAGTQTVGDQCTAIDTEFCNQAISRCGMAGFTLADCVANNMGQCCTGSGCSALSKYPMSSVDTCKAAIDAEDCNGIANSTTPQECQTLLHQ